MYISLMEFVYNNSYQSGIGMASYEALCGRKCRRNLVSSVPTRSLCRADDL